MTISIDEAWIAREVHTWLATCAEHATDPVRVRFIGEADPDRDELLYARLLAIDIDPEDLVESSAQPDHARVTVRVGVVVRPGATAPGPVSASSLRPWIAARTIKRALDRASSSDLGDSGHDLTMGRARITQDDRPDEHPGFAVLVVTADGQCQRVTAGDDLTV